MNASPRQMVRSFQVRIALLSTILSGAVLLTFAYGTWNAVQRSAMRRIDESVRDMGERLLTGPRGPGMPHWDRMRESLDFVARSPFVLSVRGRDGTTIYESPNWPEEFRVLVIPTPDALGFDEPLPQGPFQRRGRMRFDGEFGPPNADRAPEPRGRGVDPLRRSPTYEGDSRQDDAPAESLRPLPPPMPDGAPGIPAPAPPGIPPGPFGPRMAAGPQDRPVPIRALPFQTRDGGGKRWRVGIMGSPEFTIAFGLDLGPHVGEMNRLWSLLIFATPCALLAIGVSGWWLARRALRPIDALTHAAEGITAQGLDQRISGGEADIEFARLIHVFNSMLDRLEKSFQQTARFSADAAHELKTPLTILQGELTQAVQDAAPGSEHQQVLTRLLEEVQRLKSITRKLLLLSLADAGRLKPHLEPANLSELIDSAKDDIEVLGPGLQVRAEIAPDVWVAADPDLFPQVIQNLVSNAVKYNEEGGDVELLLQSRDGFAQFTISNAGRGIPLEDRGRVFERFYRADKARNRGVDGVGLGLSLSREIARAHHGELALDPTENGRTQFLMTMPLVARPAIR